jgi:phosphoribosylanthranilate isomerase
MPLLVKICGLTSEDAVAAALDAGANLVGFVFHPRSPRFVTPQRAAELAAQARGRAGIVALTVDAGDAELAAIVATLDPDWLQLHGRESRERLHELRNRTGCGRGGRPEGSDGLVLPPPVIKALGIADAADIATVRAYAGLAPLLLLDAKPPRDAAYPGGHGRPFDWSLLRQLSGGSEPFMLSGGLSPANVGEAIRTLRGHGVNIVGVDVSSGVETAPGVKDTTKIGEFVAAARAADAEVPGLLSAELLANIHIPLALTR